MNRSIDHWEERLDQLDGLSNFKCKLRHEGAKYETAGSRIGLPILDNIGVQILEQCDFSIRAKRLGCPHGTTHIVLSETIKELAEEGELTDEERQQLYQDLAAGSKSVRLDGEKSKVRQNSEALTQDEAKALYQPIEAAHDLCVDVMDSVRNTLKCRVQALIVRKSSINTSASA